MLHTKHKFGWASKILALAVCLAVITSLVGVNSAQAAEGDPVGYWLLEADGTVYSCGDAAKACNNGNSGAVLHHGDAFEPKLVVGDDFTATTLDTSLWTEAGNVLGGASFAYPGGSANLAVPAGNASYQPWTLGNRAPTLRQDISNVDFDVVARFTSTPSEVFQLQGIVVADANGTFLRFDVYWDGTTVRAFAADPLTSATPLIDVAVPTTGHAANVRVTRTGNMWELRTSPDGTVWTSHGIFERDATVDGLGPYAGNAKPNQAGTAPAFTGVIDFFGPVVAPAMTPTGTGSLASGVTAIAIVPTASGDGYVILLSDGSVVARGDATHHGNLSDPVPAALLTAGERGTAMSLTTSGAGYWIFTNLGRAVTFGDAVHFGDLPALAITPNRDVVSSAATAGGYYMLGADGGVFSFGGAKFFNSVPGVLPGVTLDCDVVGLVPTPGADGYWMVGCDGGVFTFGGAEFVGSVPGVLGPIPLAAPVNGMVAYGGGYLMVASDGGTFTFGAPFFGSLGAVTLDTDIVSIAVAAEPAVV